MVPLFCPITTCALPLPFFLGGDNHAQAAAPSQCPRLQHPRPRKEKEKGQQEKNLSPCFFFQLYFFNGTILFFLFVFALSSRRGFDRRKKKDKNPTRRIPFSCQSRAAPDNSFPLFFLEKKTFCTSLSAAAFLSHARARMRAICLFFVRDGRHQQKKCTERAFLDQKVPRESQMGAHITKRQGLFLFFPMAYAAPFFADHCVGLPSRTNPKRLNVDTHQEQNPIHRKCVKQVQGQSAYNNPPSPILLSWPLVAIFFLWQTNSVQNRRPLARHCTDQRKKKEKERDKNTWRKQVYWRRWHRRQSTSRQPSHNSRRIQSTTFLRAPSPAWQCGRRPRRGTRLPCVAAAPSTPCAPCGTPRTVSTRHRGVHRRWTNSIDGPLHLSCLWWSAPAVLPARRPCLPRAPRPILHQPPTTTKVHIVRATPTGCVISQMMPLPMHAPPSTSASCTRSFSRPSRRVARSTWLPCARASVSTSLPHGPPPKSSLLLGRTVPPWTSLSCSRHDLFFFLQKHKVLPTPMVDDLFFAPIKKQERLEKKKVFFILTMRSQTLALESTKRNKGVSPANLFPRRASRSCPVTGPCLCGRLFFSFFLFVSCCSFFSLQPRVPRGR